MGNQKQKWTADEEKALLDGVKKHGTGKWKNILRDPQFAPSLANRSNIDLKDKWRNLGVGGNPQQGSKDKIRGPKLKTTVVTPLSNTPNSAPPASLSRNFSNDAIMNGPSTSALDGKNGSKYDAMIFEAISTIKDVNGSDISAIVHFIEERREAPPNFRRLLSSRLRRLVLQGKLEKVRNCYKITNDTSLGVKTPTTKQKDARLRPPQKSTLVTTCESVEEASITAAYRIADAENKSFLAAEAMKEAERVSMMAEDTDAMLRLVKEIHEQCSRGETVLLA